MTGDAREPIRLIAGLPRAGTTWLCQTLNEHPDCAGFGQTEFWAKAWVDPDASGRYDAARLAQVRRRLRDNPLNVTIGRRGPGWMKRLETTDIPALIDGALPESAAPLTPGEAFERVSSAIARAEGKRCAIEKTPGHVHWLDRVMAHSHDARVVVTVRDPYAFMLSYKHQGDRKGPEARAFFQRRYHPIGAAIVWRSALRRAAAAASRWPERALIVRVEEMESSPGETLRAVLELLDLAQADLAGAIPRVNSSFTGGPKPSLGAADVFWMNRVAGRAIRRAGYATTPTPREYGAIARSFVMIPVWAFRVGREISERVGRSGLRYAARHLLGPRGAGRAPAQPGAAGE